jgi:hypothetical protein
VESMLLFQVFITWQADKINDKKRISSARSSFFVVDFAVYLSIIFYFLEQLSEKNLLLKEQKLNAVTQGSMRKANSDVENISLP